MHPQRNAFRPRCCLICGTVIALSAIAGCSGSATIQAVSLHPSEIDPPGTRVTRVDADEAYWHVDESGDLNLSIRMRRVDWILGEFGRQELALSIVPGPPPNGRARNYKINRDSLRMLWQTGLAVRRFASYAGVMAIYMDDELRLHGSFRFWTTNPGEGMPIWFVPQTPGPTLLFGTFKAVKDEVRCQSIRESVEAKGWHRRRRNMSTSRPAESQSTTSSPVTSRPAATQSVLDN